MNEVDGARGNAAPFISLFTAALLGASQPRISNLVRGKIDRFSIDTLISMLGHAGVHVSLVVKRRVGAA